MTGCRVAAVDCGTNSLRLLIADAVTAPGGVSLTEVERCTRIVRLGEGIDAAGRIHPAAMQRALATARGYAARCDEWGVQRLRFVATSATRDAANAAEFTAGVREAFAPRDVTPRVLSGREEAALSFAGATAGLPDAGLPGPYLVVDLGGGSTEFVLGQGDAVEGISVDVGAVRLAERHGLLPGAGPAAVAAAGADVDAAVESVASRLDLRRVRTLVGVAGTVTTVTAHAHALPSYQRDRVHLAVTPLQDAVAAADDLVAADRATLAALPYLHPGRVDVIGAGALIWSRVLRRVAAASGVTVMVTSEHDILDGVALALAAGEPTLS